MASLDIRTGDSVEAWKADDALAPDALYVCIARLGGGGGPRLAKLIASWPVDCRISPKMPDEATRALLDALLARAATHEDCGGSDPIAADAAAAAT